MHTTNRYRHELELRYKAEKITQERLLKSIGEKDQLLDQQNRKIIDLQESIVRKDRRVAELHQTIKDMKDEFSQKVSKYTFEVNELKSIVGKTRVASKEWETKYAHTETELLQNKQTLITKTEQIRLLEIDKNQLDIRLKTMNETLQHERKEREEYEQRAHENLLEMQRTSLELKEMVAVSRQLEQ